MHNRAAGGGNGDVPQAERKKQVERCWGGTWACLRKTSLTGHEFGVGRGAW